VIGLIVGLSLLCLPHLRLDWRDDSPRIPRGADPFFKWWSVRFDPAPGDFAGAYNSLHEDRAHRNAEGAYYCLAHWTAPSRHIETLVVCIQWNFDHAEAGKGET
jgi:hypothetical protein